MVLRSSGILRRRSWIAAIALGIRSEPDDPFGRMVEGAPFAHIQDLAEVALYGSFDSPVALNVVQVPRAQNHKGGGGQNYGELQGQYQSSSLVPIALQLHSDATKHSLAAQRMCQWGVKRCKRL